MSSTSAPELVLARDAGAITVTMPGHRLRLTAAEAATVLAELLADDHAACTIPLEPTGPVLSGSPVPTMQPSDTSSSAAPRPTPPPAPAPVDAGAGRSSASVYTTSTTGTPTPALPLTAFVAFTEGGGDVYMIPTARDWAARLGATDDEIVETIENPDEEWLTDTAEVVCAVGSRIGVKVSTSDGAILAVCRAHDMDRFRPRRTASIPRGRGGAGRRYPTDIPALLALLDERGFTVETRGSGHYGVQPRGWPDDQFVTIPRTPSDSRSLINSIKQIEGTVPGAADMNRRARRGSAPHRSTRTAKPELAAAMRELRRSSAASRHTPVPRKGTRRARREQAIRDHRYDLESVPSWFVAGWPYPLCMGHHRRPSAQRCTASAVDRPQHGVVR